MPIFDSRKPLNAAFTDAIGNTLRLTLDARRTGGAADTLIDVADSLARGGKRLRPAFCAWGYLAVSPAPTAPAPLLSVAASLELLHLSALVHDDVMDSSASRHGQPAAHVQLAAAHRAYGWHGDADAFGRAGAIVLGDLLATWSADLAETALPAAELPAQARVAAGEPDTDVPDRKNVTSARDLLTAVRTEVNVGQYLDVLAQARDPHEARANSEVVMALVRQVVETKTALYTVIRPLQIGAVLAGGDAALLDGLAAFGSPLGYAFQLRDDLLGVFGDPARTGKPAGDDLREGKLTVLVVHAMSHASDTDADRLAAVLGRRDATPADIDEARAIIRRSGAQAAVEADIAAAKDEALHALAACPMRDDARWALTVLANIAVDRAA